MTVDSNALTSVDVDALAGAYLYHLERSQSLHLHLTVLGNALTNHIDQS